VSITHGWEDHYPDNLYQDNWQDAGFVEVTGDLQPGDVILMQVSPINGTTQVC
jgi:hypothetical protein